MAGKVSRFLLLQNTILIKMIKEIKRKWNQHKCTSSPQNKDYWRNCWAFLELQATRKTIQTDAVLGYKTSPLVCFYGIFTWTVLQQQTLQASRADDRDVLDDALHHNWWGLKSSAPGAAGMQQQWRLDQKAPNAAHSSSQGDSAILRRWGPKAHWPEKPHAPPPLPAQPQCLVLCLALAFTSWKVKCASLSHLLDNQISWLFKPKCCESQDDKLKEHTHKAMIIAGAMGSNLSCNVY